MAKIARKNVTRHVILDSERKSIGLQYTKELGQNLTAKQKSIDKAMRKQYDRGID